VVSVSEVKENWASDLSRSGADVGTRMPESYAISSFTHAYTLNLMRSVCASITPSITQRESLSQRYRWSSDSNRIQRSCPPLPSPFSFIRKTVLPASGTRPSHHRRSEGFHLHLEASCRLALAGVCLYL